MAQIIFFDTNIILDYLEDRNQEVKSIVAQLLGVHRSGGIVLATSVFNVAELIDKEFEINYIGSLLLEKLSYDEIWGKKGDKKGIREIAIRDRDVIEKRVRDFIFDEEIQVLALPFYTTEYDEMSAENTESYEELWNLIYENHFSSQDAFIITTALSNMVTYFISNDGDIVKQINDKGLLDAYSFRDPKQREDFRNNVLDTLVEALE